MQTYDETQHELLRQTAHRACLTPEEFSEFHQRVIAALHGKTSIDGKPDGEMLYDVQMPDWPPVKWAPLVLIMSLGGPGEAAWWDLRTFTGIQPIVTHDTIELDDGSYDQASDIAWDIAREMAGDHYSQFRTAYRWQVPMFDPDQHILMRKWTERCGVDIVDFLKNWIDPLNAAQDGNVLLEVTNPDIKAEVERRGGYSPTRRSVHVDNKAAIMDAYLTDRGLAADPNPFQTDAPIKRPLTTERGGEGAVWRPQYRLIWSMACSTADGTQLDVQYVEAANGIKRLEATADEGLVGGAMRLELRTAAWQTELAGVGPGVDEPARFSMTADQIALLDSIADEDRLVANLVMAADPTVHDRDVPSPLLADPVIPQGTGITADAEIYSPTQVRNALRKAFGREFRLFGGQTSDSAIVALTPAGIDQYLAENQADARRYILDTGARNYDCENFSEELRVDLQGQYGVNGIGIVWGDGHAFNFFVEADGAKPKIRFVEPQTDKTVTDLTGAYSIERRCEVLL